MCAFSQKTFQMQTDKSLFQIWKVLFSACQFAGTCEILSSCEAGGKRVLDFNFFYHWHFSILRSGHWRNKIQLGYKWDVLYNCALVLQTLSAAFDHSSHAAHLAFCVNTFLFYFIFIFVFTYLNTLWTVKVHPFDFFNKFGRYVIRQSIYFHKP